MADRIETEDMKQKSLLSFFGKPRVPPHESSSFRSIPAESDIDDSSVVDQCSPEVEDESTKSLGTSNRVVSPPHASNTQILLKADENGAAEMHMIAHERVTHSDKNASAHHKQSDYELLRERNIERNNDRLRALGLLMSMDDSNHSRQIRKIQVSRKQAKRRKVADASHYSAYATRRSTRSKTTDQIYDGEAEQSCQETIKSGGTLLNDDNAITQVEEFTPSPLSEYTMSFKDQNSQETNVNIIGDGPINGINLTPVGPRLMPPSSLGAIYSLQFFPHEHDFRMNCSWLVGAGHGGRWIADAKFLPKCSSSSLNDNVITHAPSQLLTAGNDGTICHWDLTSSSVKTGAPKLLGQTNKTLHSSGIFSMDVRVDRSIMVTGSKDKTIALTAVENFGNPIWRSNFHAAKVCSVCFSTSEINPLIASASDDGLVAVHDTRIDGSSKAVAVEIPDSHFKPHSAVWQPDSDTLFLTAGLDDVIKLWDLRKATRPIATFHGHVPANGKKLKRIHRPTFVHLPGASSSIPFILTGGEGSHSLSMFTLDDIPNDGSRHTVFNSGRLPDASDVGTLTVYGSNVAVAVEGGEVLLLSPKA